MTDVDKGDAYEFDPSISEEEREFYLKAYPTPEYVRDRKSHCTTCKVHIGTAPCNHHGLKMHPILRVTHCNTCHDFYNSGEFSKGEDGSELYCRWCGQGGEVYCCSNCPFVFCKSCITKNLSRGVVADIEQNENWRCFACAPKILWPLRALHWALVNYIEKQKKDIDAMNLPEVEKKIELTKDRSTCCRLAKAKCGNMSDSMESVDSLTSRRSSSSNKKKLPTAAGQTPPSKRLKTSNDEVVCTPDLMSMLEPDCQITVQPKQPTRIQPVTTPKIFTVQQNYMSPQQRSSAPPPLVLRNTGVQLRPVVANPPVIRRTVVSPRTPAPAGSNSPVYHTINGYRIDLNSAAQQGTYRLPNGKLIQVKRQSTPTAANSTATTPVNNWPQPQGSQRVLNTLPRTVQITPQRPFVAVQQAPVVQGMPVQQQQQAIRYPSGVIGNTVIAPFNQNGPQIQMINGVSAVGAPAQQVSAAVAVRPALIRHTFPDNPVGQARTQLQDQIFSAMEICQHLTGKLQTLTNSNAYKQARNFMEVKELYIHLSYLLTYANGRYKGLQDKCLADMRQLGFANDADSLENGQIAAGIDYVRYGQLEDAELFTAGSNSFHNQIYEYRKSLLANLDDSIKCPLSPLHPLSSIYGEEHANVAPQQWQTQHMSEVETIIDDDDDDVQEVPLKDDSNNRYVNPYMDEDPQDDAEDEYLTVMSSSYGQQRGTEDVMRREEESHAYDRKLTRLIQQYPSIWCTRHPDYGNFEVTRKQWRTIASHFQRSEDIKMRWKNIRKRYVRIERRMQEGKRFNGYFDKATNFLINRDTPPAEWVKVDCGTDDGDVYERKKLDAIEKELHSANETEKKFNDFNDFSMTESCAPIEIRWLDMKIIHFVKCNPVLWRKSSDPTFHKMDEQTRKSLWMHLWKSVPNMRCEDLIDRWTQLYEMYKTFRLKTIKSENANAALEIKYSKYLAKLYFLYKIDEEELQSEYNALVYGDDLKEEEVESDSEHKLLDMLDDKEFVKHLMRTVREYPQIWNPNHVDYHDVQSREETWQEIAHRLEPFQHKQASDDEDNEIEIVEPKTDTIDLDSDNEDQESAPTNAKTTANQWAARRPVTITKSTSVTVSNTEKIQTTDDNSNGAEQMTDFMEATHNILASMLEIDIVEGSDVILSPGSTQAKKQPRKKTTNKPNPTLLKQKKLMEWQKLDDIKRNDNKLRSKCVILVRKAEKEFPYTVGILKQRYEKRKEIAKRLAAEKALIAKEKADLEKEKAALGKEMADQNKDDVVQILNDNGTVEKKDEVVDKNESVEKDESVNEENKDELPKEIEVPKVDEKEIKERTDVDSEENNADTVIEKEKEVVEAATANVSSEKKLEEEAKKTVDESVLNERHSSEKEAVLVDEKDTSLKQQKEEAEKLKEPIQTEADITDIKATATLDSAESLAVKERQKFALKESETTDKECSNVRVEDKNREIETQKETITGEESSSSVSETAKVAEDTENQDSKLTTEPVAMQTNDEEVKHSNGPTQTTSSDSSNTSKAAKESSVSSDDTHIDKLEQLGASNDQNTNDIEMAIEANATQTAPTHNEVEANLTQNIECAVNDDVVEHMDTSLDIFSVSSSDLTTSTAPSKDIPEIVTENTNASLVAPQAMSVVTNTDEQ